MDFVTIYFAKSQFMPGDETFSELGKHLNREIGIGSGFVNVYTKDKAIVSKAIAWIKARNLAVREIA